MPANRRSREKMTTVNAGLVFVLALVFCVAGMRLALAADELYVYPSKGQSQQQQSKDRYECHEWAVQQTGFDPSAPVPAPAVPQTTASSTQPPPPGGEAVRGAARGAALGAIGGAIAGDAGKGAAAGAAVGGTMGVLRRGEERRVQEEAQQVQMQQQQAQQAAQQAQQAAQQAALQNQRQQYDRALGSCLEGRGYTVK